MAFNLLASPLFLNSAVYAQTEFKLTANDAAAGDQFGRAVAVNGDLAIVGAPFGDDGPGSNSGSAYIFVRSGRAGARRLNSKPVKGRDLTFSENPFLLAKTLLS